MKRIFPLMLAGLLLLTSVAAWTSDEGAALYKKKCAACHGAGGEGKPAMKAPAVKGTTMSVDQLVQHITKGEPTSKSPHNKGISGVSMKHAEDIAKYIKTL